MLRPALQRGNRSETSNPSLAKMKEDRPHENTLINLFIQDNFARCMGGRA
jgi:hypothetical protein